MVELVESRRRLLALAVVITVLGAGVVAWRGGSGGNDSTPVAAGADIEAATTSTREVPDTTTSTSTSTTAPATTSTAARRSTTTRAVSPPPAADAPDPAPAPAPSGTSGISAYQGLGTWVDAFDFDPAHTGGNPSVRPSDVARMAAAGVRTVYLQAARSEDPAAPGDLMSPDLLGQFLTQAHAHGLQVVAWFLPHHADVADDMRHLDAIVGFTAGGHRFDSVALDIEWRAGADHATRSKNLVEVSRRLRESAGGRAVGAIVMPPVVTDVISPGFWPGFPWLSIAPYYDVWLPMSYWTNRSADSSWRDAYVYTSENVKLLRNHVGGAAVHVVGGIGNAATTGDYEGFVRAAVEHGTVGRSVYDWATTSPESWATLAG